MTHHLSPQEFVDALDATLATRRLDHLEACAGCRADLDRLRATVIDVRGADVPEPSPLFWDHFSERVRQATAGAPAPVPAAWWGSGWRPLAGFAAGLAAVVLAAVFWPRAEPATAPAPLVVESVVPAGAGAPGLVAEDDAPWELFMSLASTLSYDDVRQVAAPRPGTADGMIEQLTPAEREALARMLYAGIGDVE